MEQLRGCIRCLDGTGKHQVDTCPVPESSARKCSRCPKQHSDWLHSSSNPYVAHNGAILGHTNNTTMGRRPNSAVVTTDQQNVDEFDRAPTPLEIAMNEEECKNTMFLVQHVPIQCGGQNSASEEGCIFFDPGSNTTMVRHSFAQRLGLIGRDYETSLVRTGGDIVRWKTKAYFLRFVNTNGDISVLIGLGVDTISTALHPVDVTPALQLFKEVASPDVLVGFNHMEIFPQEMGRVGALALWESQFGTGFMLSGTHPTISMNYPDMLTEEVEGIRLSTHFASYLSLIHI